MDKEKSDLKKLKENYSDLEKKHNLPSFEKLSKDFNVEGLPIETDFLIREVRKIIGDKVVGYLRFIENLLNPVNVPIFIYSLVKNMKIEEKNKLNELYQDFSNIEIEFIKLDLDYDEKKEAEFVNDIFNKWQDHKKSLIKIIDSLNKNSESKSESGKGYFG